MAATIYQLKITLVGSQKPPIWRKIQISSEDSLYLLHCTIQGAMGWLDAHLHQFSARKGRGNFVHYGIPDVLDDMDFDERETKLSEVLTKKGDKMSYTYDMGDNWEHDIVLEQILPFDEKARYPILLEGKGACPIEDSGGIAGYYEMLEIIKDPKHPEHADLMEWLEGENTNPNAFSIAESRAEMLEAYDEGVANKGIFEEEGELDDVSFSKVFLDDDDELDDDDDENTEEGDSDGDDEIEIDIDTEIGDEDMDEDLFEDGEESGDERLDANDNKEDEPTKNGSSFFNKYYSDDDDDDDDSVKKTK